MLSMGISLWLDIFKEVMEKHKIPNSVQMKIFTELPYCYNKRPPWEKYIPNWKAIIKETYEKFFLEQFTDGKERFEKWLKENQHYFGGENVAA